tara:strand:- start:440 stop:1066 length:627 start_codon:yes stop_codon:yes gene_type:complete
VINPDLLLAFVATFVVVCLLPGPVVLVVVAQSLCGGSRRGLTAVAGATLGNIILYIIAATGLAVLATLLAEAFAWLRWFGVGYLGWLGVQYWRTAKVVSDKPEPLVWQQRAAFISGLVVAVSNPKAVLFYAALLPLFIDAGLPATPQLVVLGVISIPMSVVFNIAYALLAGKASGYLVEHDQRVWIGRVSGGFFMVAAVLLGAANWQR